jgi:hypothetical protein
MTTAAYAERCVPLCLTLTRAEQFTLYLRARDLHELLSDPTLSVGEMAAVRDDFLRAAKKLAQHGVNFWRGGPR